MSALADLNTLGQSVWLDSISRDWLQTGELRTMIDELAIVGVTSNPTIFAAALTSDTYDEDIRKLSTSGASERDIFASLAVADIQGACDLLAPVYERSGGSDGMVSIELEPDLALDAAASIERAQHLWDAVERPNVMIKVPATDECIPAIEEIVARGINVNVTLLFSVEVYRKVMEAYLQALERRVAAGQHLQVASVASFFVSRVDTAVDPLLQQAVAADLQSPASALLGKVAVANAAAAFHASREVFSGESWDALQRKGAQPQRPLWASTGTKNQSYSDILYVQELIAPGTVNTMPLSTMRAFADHGVAQEQMPSSDAAQHTLDQLADLGIDLAQVTDELRTAGVASFQASYDELIDGIAAKRPALRG